MDFVSLTLRNLLEADVDVQKALRTLNTNLSDIGAWTRAHRVARRHGKVLGSIIGAGGNVDEYIVDVRNGRVHYHPRRTTGTGPMISFALSSYIQALYKVVAVDPPEGLFDN